MKPGYHIMHDPRPPFKYKDKSIAVFNWKAPNTIFMQTISGDDISHLDITDGLVAHFKIKWKTNDQLSPQSRHIFIDS